jgi:23S rRNA pseudouridine1911/1915/1917 synthase
MQAYIDDHQVRRICRSSAAGEQMMEILMAAADNIRKNEVDRASAGQTLLDFVAASLGCSKRRAKGLLDSRRVFVNRRRLWMARHILKLGDIVELPDLRELAGSGRDEPLPLLYRDETLLILNKPAGLLTQGAGSVESILTGQLGVDYARAVHRLDRDTSGALIVALDPRMRAEMIELFRSRALQKDYLAIVTGIYRGPRIIDRRLDGKEALTEVRIISTAPEASLLGCRIETGRTHQIRKHLGAVGHPILGDKQYGRHLLESADLRHIPRQMLHAYRLAFAHPGSGRRMDLTAAPADDFKQTAQRLSLAIADSDFALE